MEIDLLAQKPFGTFQLAIALGALTVGDGHAQPVAGPSEKEAPADDELDHPEGLAGTEVHEWWLNPKFAFRLQNEGGLDNQLQAWPENLIEGVGTTSGQAVFEHRFGPFTLQLGAGLGMTTSRTAAGTISNPQSPRRSVPTPVVGASLELDLPGRWYLRAGASASRGSWSVGLQAGTEF